MLLPIMPVMAADPTPPLTGITVTPDNIEILPGPKGSQEITITPEPVGAVIDKDSIKYECQETFIEIVPNVDAPNKATITVEDNPAYNGEKATVTVTAEDENGNTVNKDITIQVKDVKKVIPNQEKYVLTPGETVKVGVTLQPEGIRSDIKWAPVPKETGDDDVIKFDETTGNVSVTEDAVGGEILTLTAEAENTQTKPAPSTEIVIEVSKVIKQIIINDSGKELKVGEKFQVEIGTPTFPLTEKDVEWTSSNPKVASVDKNGIITALSAGSTEITVKAKKPHDNVNYAQATIQITVAGVVENDTITVDNDVVYLQHGVEQTVISTLKPTAAKDIAYTVDNDKIIVKQNITPSAPAGKIIYNANGKATLKISVEDDSGLTDGQFVGTITIGGEGCAPAKIQVYYYKNAINIEEITLSKKVVLKLNDYVDEKGVSNGETYQPKPIFRPSTITNYAVTWKVDNQKLPDGTVATSDIITIDPDTGAITPKRVGTATVTVTANEKYDPNKNPASATMEVEVYEKVEENKGQPILTIEGKKYPDKGEIRISGQKKLEAVLDDDFFDADNEIWIWSSNKNSVLTILTDANGKYVDDNGKEMPNGAVWLQTLSPGKAELTVRGSISGQRRTFTVVVEEERPHEFEIIYEGDTLAESVQIGAESELPANDKIGELTGQVAKGRKVQLEIKFPAETTEQKVKWQSSDTKIATVSNKGLVTMKSDTGTVIISAMISYKDKQIDKDGNVIKDVDGNIVYNREYYKAAVKIKACPVEEINELTVIELDEKGNEKQDIVTTGGTAPNIEFTNVYTSGVDEPNNNLLANPLVLKLGESRSFKVEGAMDDLNRASSVKWKSLTSGCVTVSQKVNEDGDTILTLKASTSGTKAGRTTRVVATNVGNYQFKDDKTDYINYPEIFVKLEAEPPESIEITSVPKILEIGDSDELQITVKPKNRDTQVTWTVNNTAIADITQNGILTGLGEGTVTVRATSVSNTNVWDEVKIPIGYKAKSVKLNATSIVLSEDEQFILQVSAQPFELIKDEYIYFKARDEYIVDVQKDPNDSTQGIVKLYVPGNPQPNEFTYVDVYIGGTENTNGEIVGYQKKLSCKVKVGEKAITDAEKKDLLEKLKGVKITSKKTDLTIEVGKGQKVSYSVSGLSTTEKKRLVVECEYIDDAADTIYVDDLGYVTVKSDAKKPSAKFKLKFSYQDEKTGKLLPIGDINNTNETQAVIEYTINVKPILKAQIGNNDPVIEPTITVTKADDTFEIRIVPTPELDTKPEYGLTTNSSFKKYLEVKPQGITDGVVDYYLLTVKDGVTLKKTKATLTFTEPSTKAKVRVDINIKPE